MAITLTSTQPGSNADYMRYLYGGSLQKTNREGDSVLLDFSLAPFESAFVKLTRGSYITVDSATYPKWFTGYITAEPEYVFMGSKTGAGVWCYKYQVTSDECLLSLQSLGIMDPFTNTSMGTVLTILASSLAPGVFDMSNIQPGLSLARYVVDPTKKFFDIVKEFSDAANYRFWGNDHKLYFAPATASPAGVSVDGNDKNFTPSRLTLQPALDSVVNDATVVGLLEPQKYVHEYFIGTGFDSSFPLASDVFGTDTNVLLDETFQSSTLDANTWLITDPGLFLKLLNGYLNILGGSGAYDTSVQSVSSIPLEGSLRLTHGEWDFVATGSAYICGLWSQTPNSSRTGLVYGIAATPSGSNVNLSPVINGVVDTSQVYTINPSLNLRYVIRTVAKFGSVNRTLQEYTYVDQSGTVQQLGGTSLSDTVDWTTTIAVINPVVVTDPITLQTTVSYTADGEVTWSNPNQSISSAEAFGIYVPIFNANLHATVSNITLSVPLQAHLEKSTIAPLINGNFDLWTDSTHAVGWGVVGGTQETVLAQDGSAVSLLYSGSNPFIYQNISTAIKPGIVYAVFFRTRRIAGTTGTFNVNFGSLSVPSLDQTQSFNIASTLSSSQYSSYSLAFGPFASVPSDFTFGFGPAITSGSGTGVILDNVMISEVPQSRVLGPNEVDSLDGLAPTATIVNGTTAPSSSSLTGVQQYTPTQAQLVFFKNSNVLVSTTPAANQIFHLNYRGSGWATARVRDASSVSNESSLWGDTGVRSVVRTDIQPQPKTSAECEMAASSLVSAGVLPHWKGAYTQFSDYCTREPQPGQMLFFNNLPLLTGVTGEQIQEVVTTVESLSPERFNHKMTFGEADQMRQILTKIYKPINSLSTLNASNNVQIPYPLVTASVGRAYAPDVPDVSLVGWDTTHLYFQINNSTAYPAAADGGYELRLTDDSWGCESGRNLVSRFYWSTGVYPQFSLPISSLGNVIYVRAFDGRNHCIWSEDQTQSVYSIVGARSLVTNSLAPDGKYANVTSIGASFGTASITHTGVATPSDGTTITFSASVFGTAPHSAQLTVAGITGNTTSTFNGAWQRLSFTFTTPSGFQAGHPTLNLTVSVLGSNPRACEVTWFSCEFSPAETSYCKTLATAYGANSRYSTLVHSAFMLDPNTASNLTQRTVTTSQAINKGDLFILCDSNFFSLPFTLYLPAATSMDHPLTIKKISDDPNIITLQCAAGDLIDGSATYQLVNQYDSITIAGGA